MNLGRDEEAEGWLEKFNSKVELKSAFVFRSGKMVKKLGMRMFYEPMDPDPLATISPLSVDNIRRVLKKTSEETKLGYEHLDVFVSFKDPEILKLFFGQRHCKNLYSA